MPITADDDFYLDNVAPVHYKTSNAKIYCPFDVNKDDGVSIHIQVWDTAGTNFYQSVTIASTEAELEAYSSGESGEFSVFKNIIEQRAVDYLESVTNNAGITFTIV